MRILGATPSAAWRTTMAAITLAVVCFAAACSQADSTVERPQGTLGDRASAPTEGEAGPSSQPAPGVQRVQRLVFPVRSVDSMPATWQAVFVVPYGPGRERLGTSRGGERDRPRYYGPESGAVAQDGSWWFLDVAKQRLAHYDAHGAFIEAVKVPARLLVNGRYFQWAQPHVLSDGTLVAFRLTSGAGAMLRLRDGVLDEVPLTAMFSPNYDDGTLLYGTVADGGGLVTLDPDTGDIRPAPAYRLPSGDAFTVEDDFDRGVLRVETDAGSVRLATVTPSGGIAHMGVQFRAAADDSLHLYLIGTSNRSAAELVGYIRIDRDGAVTKLEPLSRPSSVADRGSPAQLVVAPADSTPMLVYVMPHGVHVYRRTG